MSFNNFVRQLDVHYIANNIHKAFSINDVEPSTNHCEQKNKPRTGTQGFQC
jgi:hypothetical protein